MDSIQIKMIDEAVLHGFPLVAIPPSGLVPDATKNGVRYLMGKQTIWRELKLPWLFVREPLASSTGLNLPYGEVEDCKDILVGNLPVALIRQFKDYACEHCTVEVAAALIWHEQTAQWRYAVRKPIEQSGSHIVFAEPRLDESECLVVDMHSHGRHPASFSSDDDRDDCSGMKISLVVGNCDQTTQTYAMRLCVMGRYTSLEMTGTGQLEVQHASTCR